MPTEDDIEDYRISHERSMEIRKRPPSLLDRRSKPVIVHKQDEDGQWRSSIKMSRIKFDDEAKGIFLDEYRKWGRMGDAAHAAGVTTATVRKHIEEDEDFAHALLMAEDEYKDKLIAHHQDLVFNGTMKESYDRNGNLVSREQIFPIRLIELELKKHDSAYRDKQELSVNHSGGVLLAPAEMGSIDDWEKRFAQAKDVTPQPPMVEIEEEPTEED